MSSDVSGYKAIVCIFLYGGNQSFNMVVPTSTTKYNEYANTRGSLAVPSANVLPLNPTYFTAQDGYQYGLHPSLKELQNLANTGKIAVISNVGPLVQPTTNTAYKAGTVKLPYQLFSHPDQENQWQTAIAGLNGNYGWGGRFADVLFSEGLSPNLSFNVSVAGSFPYVQGTNTNPYIMGAAGGIPYDQHGYGGYQGGQHSNTMNYLITQGQSHPHVLIREFANTAVSSQNKYSTVANVFALSDFSANIVFNAQDDFANEMHGTARMIKGQSLIGDSRQIFFNIHYGYDTHDGEAATQNTLYLTLANTIYQFYNAMVEIGQNANVVICTISDFGRSLVPNGDGSDHGWGGVAMVIGDPVIPGMYGKMPSYVAGGPDDADTTGRVIPTTSVEQYAASIMRWFGIRGYQSANVFPNIVNFEKRRVGFPYDFLPPAKPIYSYTVSNTVTANAFTNTPQFTQPNGGKAVVQVNNFDTSATGFITQNTWANSEKDFGIYAHHVNDGNVKSYTSYCRGWKSNVGFLTTSDTYLATSGIQLNSLTKAKARFAFEGPSGNTVAVLSGGSGTSANNRVNTLWDIYIHSTASPGANTAPSAKLMLQQFTLDSDATYLANAANATMVTIGNSSYGILVANNVIYNGNAAQTFTQIQIYPGAIPNTTYAGIQDATANLKAIFDYFTANNVINSTHYLTSIQMGWQIHSGNYTNIANASGVYITNEVWTALQAEADGVVGDTAANSFVAL